MAITAGLLAGAYNGADAAFYDTASFAPGASRLVLFGVGATRGGSLLPPQPTIDQGTWVLVDGVDYDATGATQAACWVFRSMSGSPASAVRRIDFGGTTITSCVWSVVEFDGVDTSGSDGAGAVVQAADTGAGDSGTSNSITLASFGSAENAGYGLFLHQANENSTPGAGGTFNELHDLVGTTPVHNLLSEWLVNQNVVDASWTSSVVNGGVAAEIKAAAGGPPPSTDVLSPQTFRGRYL